LGEGQKPDAPAVKREAEEDWRRWQKDMDKIALLGFLIAATSLEATGDAVVCV
jgi:hypothetical protein